MAFYIVIGTNNDVKGVVDEVRRSHLQHNVITTGCILSEDEKLYYHWDVFNENGNKTIESKDTITLHDALTNQISQFRTLLPDDAVPNVFIVSKCFDEIESKTLQMVFDELCQIGGAMLSGLLVDIILLGYDLKKPKDVTIRPHWRILKSIRGLGEECRFHTNILYVNNMDYMGAATNVDSRILSKFICYWSKMVSSGGNDPKATIQSRVYSIGMSEHQYDFSDLKDFFKLSAEERLLDRTLNNTPSHDTQELLDTNYFKKIDLDIPWLDGLCHIQTLWESYCTSEWDPSKSVCENDYSVSKQEQILASYLNTFLKLYISEEQCDIVILNDEIAGKENRKNECSDNILKLSNLPDEDETKIVQIRLEDEQINQLNLEIEECKRKILSHKNNIRLNTFLDADSFHESYGTRELLTEEDEIEYVTNKAIVERLIDYVKSEKGVNIMREAIDRATEEKLLPDQYPESTVLNMGRLKAISLPTEESTSMPLHLEVHLSPENQREEPGCLYWLKSLFNRDKRLKETDVAPNVVDQHDISAPISDETRKLLKDALGKSVAAIRKVDDVRNWWKRLCTIIDMNQKRLEECVLLMNGKMDVNGVYLSGMDGYHPQNHRKSTSLIDMDRVRTFRDSDDYYKQIITKFLEQWFDKTIELPERRTMLELIKHQIIDPLLRKYQILQWDGGNPFMKDDLNDEEMHAYIETDINQSRPFVEYVRIQETNLISNISIVFLSNNKNVPTDNTSFKMKYNVGAESIIPVFLQDFVNSLCVIQIMDIPNHIDALKDFKPRREAKLSKMRTDIKAEVATIVENANTVEDKARAIYNWICENIAYDTIKQIHDAETCFKTRRGVCQAYCELFCYMAEAVGLTVEIITGITKDAEGKISSDKHSWIFVYTHAYDGIFIDPTWGAGSVDGVKFIKNDDSSIWFDVSPYDLIFSHFPDKQDWTNLDITITEEQFRKLPYFKMANDINSKDFLFECLSQQQNNRTEYSRSEIQ